MFPLTEAQKRFQAIKYAEKVKAQRRSKVSEAREKIRAVNPALSDSALESVLVRHLTLTGRANWLA